MAMTDEVKEKHAALCATPAHRLKVKQSVKTRHRRWHNRMMASMCTVLNRAHWPGLVPKSVALQVDNTNPVPYVHRRDR